MHDIQGPQEITMEKLFIQHLMVVWYILSTWVSEVRITHVSVLSHLRATSCVQALTGTCLGSHSKIEFN